MNKFKNRLILIAGFAVVAITGTLMTARDGVAQGPPDGLSVKVVNTPLAVTGSLGVAGTVAATQSGTWNVGITGQVVNADSPGRHPFQASWEGPTFQTSVVPPQHRLVVQQVAATTILNNQPNAAPNLLAVAIRLPSGPRIGDPVFQFPVVPVPGAQHVSVMVAPLTAYVDAGKLLSLSFGNIYVGAFFTSGTVSGYMLDCSVAACDAIAP